jgi:hypothetical protein
MIDQPAEVIDLTPDDMQLVVDMLNDYLDTFDAEEEFINGVVDPQSKHDAVEGLLGRLIGVDLSAPFQPHHVECSCDWCELERG